MANEYCCSDEGRVQEATIVIIRVRANFYCDFFKRGVYQTNIFGFTLLTGKVSLEIDDKYSCQGYPIYPMGRYLGNKFYQDDFPGGSIYYWMSIMGVV